MITKDLNAAVNELNAEGIVAIPTETVYGLAGNAFSSTALKKIFDLKKRPLFNPLIVHLKSAEQLEMVAENIPEVAIQLAQEFWPGPLTLVLKKKSIIPDLVSAGKDTVAVRVPNHPLTLELLAKLDFPLAAPSANPFGSISPTTAKHVEDYFQENLSVILDGGDCQKGIESTIIGFENNQAILYRLGSLSIEKIEEKIGKLKLKNNIDESSPEAPGMLSKHYAPATSTLFTDDIEKLIAQNSGKKFGLLLFKNYSDSLPHSQQEILSTNGNLEEAAKNLYAAMHRLDKMNLDVIIAEYFPNEGLGKTINDKLKRASTKD